MAKLSAEETNPLEVRRVAGKPALAVDWQSGHKSEYNFSLLRGFCPCAVCQGHSAGPKKFIPSPPDLLLEKIKTVGNYALQFYWSDAHSTGIYTFEYLRTLCPCAQCVQASQPQ